MTRSNVRDLVVDHPVTIVACFDGEDRSFVINGDPDRCDFITNDGVEVTMHRARGSQMVFRDNDSNQVGPAHQHMVAALTFAAHEGWRDPSDPAWWHELGQAEHRQSCSLCLMGGRTAPWPRRTRERRKLVAEGEWAP